MLWVCRCGQEVVSESKPDPIKWSDGHRCYFVKVEEKKEEKKVMQKKCQNKVSQFVPRGFGHKEIKSPCGSTGIRGQQLICDECLDKLEKRYPQGWRDTPGDTCKHGYYVGDAGGPDYLCPKCEDGL